MDDLIRAGDLLINEDEDNEVKPPFQGDDEDSAEVDSDEEIFKDEGSEEGDEEFSYSAWEN